MIYGFQQRNPATMRLAERLRVFGTTDPRAVQQQGMQAPTQFIPQYQGGAITSAIREYSQQMSNLMGQATPFTFQAQPITFNDVRSREVSARAAADESLGYNEANLQRYAGMAQQLTEADTAVRMQALDQFVPQWRTQRDTAAAINEAYMKGEVPRDVANKLQRDAAFMGLASGGYQGGENIRSVTARDLGLTSYDLQQRGMAGAQSWTQLMAGLMPEQTTAAGVMATQGMTPQMALETSLQNASNQLQADITTAQGSMTAATQTQDIGLRAQTARTAAEQGWAGIAARGYESAMEAATSNIANQYAAAMNASAIAFGNVNRPYQSYRESLGLTSGQRQRTGFGL